MAVLVVGLIALLVGLPAGAADPVGPTPSAAPGTNGAGDAAVSVEVTAVSPQVLTAGADLTVSVLVRNDGTEAVARPRADLLLSRFRLGDRQAVADWADGTSTLAAGTSVAVGSLDTPLAAGAGVRIDLVVPAASVRLANVWGPRGLTVVVHDGRDEVAEARTFLLWQSTEDIPRAQVAVLVPVVGADDDRTGVPPGGRLDRLAAALTTSDDIAVAVDPALLRAAQAQGGSAADWADRLTGLMTRREAFALPWDDADVSTADAELLGQARTLAVQRAPGLRGDLAWAPDGALDGRTAAAVTSSGGRAIVVGTDAALDASPATVGTPSGDLTVLSADPVLTAALSDGSTTAAAAAQRMLADLAVVARDENATGLLVAPGRDWSPDPGRVDALTGALAAAPWVRLTTVATLLGQPATATELPVRTADEARMGADDLRALSTAWSTLTRFAQVAADPSAVLDGAQEAVLAPLSVAWRDDPAGRSALVARTVAELTARRAGLAVVPPSDLTVASATSEARFALSNGLSTAVTVQVQVTPRKGCLEPALSDPVTVAAGEETSVPVTLRATANCDVRVEVVLVDPTGTALSEPVELTARVRPTIESVGTAVVGVLLGVGLVLGLVRTVRRGQGARRGARRVAEADDVPLGVLGGGTPSGE